MSGIIRTLKRKRIRKELESMATTTVKMGMVSNILRGLDIAFPGKLKARVALKKLKIAASLTRENDAIRDIFRATVQEYAEKNEDGSLKLTDPNSPDTFTIPDERRAEYEKEITELLEQQSGPIEMFDESDFENDDDINYEGLVMMIPIINVPELQELLGNQE